MKKWMKGLLSMMGLLILAVIILCAKGICPYEIAANIICVTAAIFLVYVLVYFRKIVLLRKVILALVLEAERVYGSGEGRMKYEYVLAKAYAYLPSILRAMVSLEFLDQLVEDAVEVLHRLLEENISEQQEIEHEM